LWLQCLFPIMAGCLDCDDCCGSPFGNKRRRVRAASHAGSWYPSDPATLRARLESLLAEIPRVCTPGRPPKALIVPHAGLRYCGRTAAHAFTNLDAGSVERVVVLGPSHRKRIVGCALPARSAAVYETPLGRLPLDIEALEELRDTGDFEELSLGDDEAEHSIEMQLPFTALKMEQKGDWGLLPLVVGQLSPEDCKRYADHLAPYFDDPSTLFVLSSDFCHWGAKFRYQPRLAATSPLQPTSGLVPGMGEVGQENLVNAGIEALDLRGMDLICKQDGEAFSRYLDNEGNTICGRNPIRVFLELLRVRPRRFHVRFLHYSQSKLLGQDPGPDDSSVSYAAGICEALVAPGTAGANVPLKDS